MLRRIVNRIDNYFKKIVLNYSISDKIFVWYWNLRQSILKSTHRFYVIHNDLNTPRYKIVERKFNITKFFVYRQQGLYAFENGIRNRGEAIGNDYMLNLIKFSNDDLIIDIGANTGDLKIYFDNRNIKIVYYGFEPGNKEFNALKLNNSDDCLFNIALGDEDNLKTFFYKPETGDSSLIEMHGFDSKYQVQVKKLATIIEENSISDKVIKLLKLEAEGFEPEILLGIGKYLNSIMYISADLGFERGFKQETTAPQVLNFLLNNGFEVINMTNGRMCFLFKNKSMKVAEHNDR